MNLSPFAQQISNQFNQNPGLRFNITESVPGSVKASDVVAVAYFNDHYRISYKFQGKLFHCVASIDHAQMKIMGWKKEIQARKNPGHRVELWECRNHLDVYCLDTEKRLIFSRMTEEEREQLSVTTEKQRAG